MEAFQQRVVDEQLHLTEKLVKLIDFTTTANYRALPADDRNLLIDQRHVMASYNDILAERIGKFTA